MEKLPPGIDVHRESLRIRFSYRNIRCSEVLSGLAPTKPNIAFATNKLNVIRLEIQEGRFNYRDHFPTSKRASMFSSIKHSDRTVAEGVRKWLRVKQATVAPSGYRMYRINAEKHVIPKWGHYRFSDVQRSDLVEWQTLDLTKKGLTNKTINCILTPLRGAFDDAYGDQIIAINPMATIKNLELDAEGSPDPLTQEELTKLLTLNLPHRPQELNTYGFNAWSGLREGELLALAWEDIDMDRWVVRISRNRVEGEYKVPKTKASVREFELLPEAIEFLKRQMQHTYALPPIEVSVRQRNNRSFIKEKVRHIFHSSYTNKPWSGDGPFRDAWTAVLRSAKIRHRGPNQLRHTFISQMLTQYIPPEWIAPMCGTSVAMIRKHYGKFIREDRPNLGVAIAKIREQQNQVVPNRSHDKKASK